MSMNCFRLIGDFSHLFGIVFLLFSILYKKSCHGISAKSQILFMMVYLSRYLDLFASFVSYYNSFFKIAYILISFFTCFFILIVFRRTYQQKEDTVLIEIAVFCCFVTATFRNYAMTPIEIMWAFSEYLETVALIPQFLLIINSKKVTVNVLVYLTAMLTYRGFYCFNWIYRYTEENHYDTISDLSGVAFVLVFIFYSLILVCRGVKVDKEEHFIQRNIFLISEGSIIAPQRDNEKDTNILITDKN